MKSFLKNENGQVARLLLILAAIVFVAIIITFLLVRLTDQPQPPVGQEEEQEILPIYEYQLDNIRFVFQSAIDKGNTLLASEAPNENFTPRQDLVTTEKFVIVTVGAQNKGLVNTEDRSWDIGNIIDSEGRNYVPLEGYIAESWLPEENNCGALLKPEFDPTSCTKIYEVAKGSRDLKIQVLVEDGNNEKSYELDIVLR